MLKIASLSPAITEILCALELEEHIVCRDKYSDYPEHIRSVPALPEHQAIHVPDIAKFNPDIVCTSTVIQQKLSQELTAHQYSVLHQDPRTIRQVYKSIHQIGVLFNKEQEAKELTLAMQQGFNKVQQLARLLPTKPKVYIEEWPNPPMASANWVPELIAIAGGIALPSAKVGELSTECSLQEVAAFNPDLIILSWCGAGELPEPTVLQARTGWAELPAVQQGNVRVINDSLLNRPGPRLLDGAQRIYGWLFELLH